MKAFQAVFLLFLAHSAWGQAGFKVRVNPAGMNFIRDFIEDQATGYTLQPFTIEHSVGATTTHGIEFADITIRHFHIDQVFVDKTGENEITIRVANSTLDLNGNYAVEFILSENKPDIQTGTVDFNVGLVTAQITFSIDVDENSTTSIKLKKCFIDFVDDSFSYNPSIIKDPAGASHQFALNHLFQRRLGVFEEKITGQFCDELVKPVVGQLNQLLSSSQGGTFVIVPGLLLNASLYQFPFVNSTMMEVELDGTFYPASQPNRTFPYPRPPLPQFEKSTSMVQGALSVRVLQTLLHSLAETDAFSLDLPSQGISFGGLSLDTVFSLLIPTFSTFVNGRPVTTRIVLPEIPSIELTTGNVGLNGSIGLALYAVNPDGSIDHAATFTLEVEMGGGIEIVNSQIKITVTSFSFRIGILDNPPAGQPSNLFLINSLLTQGSSNANLLPTINGFIGNLTSGLQIPPILGYSLENINLAIVDDAVLMSLDIYKVENSEEGVASTDIVETLFSGNGSGYNIDDILENFSNSVGPN